MPGSLFDPKLVWNQHLTKHFLECSISYNKHYTRNSVLIQLTNFWNHNMFSSLHISCVCWVLLWDHNDTIQRDVSPLRFSNIPASYVKLWWWHSLAHLYTGHAFTVTNQLFINLSCSKVRGSPMIWSALKLLRFATDPALRDKTSKCCQVETYALIYPTGKWQRPSRFVRYARICIRAINLHRKTSQLLALAPRKHLDSSMQIMLTLLISLPRISEQTIVNIPPGWWLTVRYSPLFEMLRAALRIPLRPIRAFPLVPAAPQSEEGLQRCALTCICITRNKCMG